MTIHGRDNDVTGIGQSIADYRRDMTGGPPRPPGDLRAAPEPKSPAVHDGLAVAALVLSLVWLGGLGAILAVIFGGVSIRTAHRENRGISGMAVAGLILGILGLIALIIVIVAIAHAGAQNDCVQNAINAGLDPSVVCP